MALLGTRVLLCAPACKNPWIPKEFVGCQAMPPIQHLESTPRYLLHVNGGYSPPGFQVPYHCKSPGMQGYSVHVDQGQTYVPQASHGESGLPRSRQPLNPPQQLGVAMNPYCSGRGRILHDRANPCGGSPGKCLEQCGHPLLPTKIHAGTSGIVVSLQRSFSQRLHGR